MESRAKESDSLVFESTFILSSILSNPEHEEFWANLRGPSRKAKYSERPIANQYCEGKVKRTSNRGVK